MLSRNPLVIIALLELFTFLALDAYATWSPTGSEVNLAGLKLIGSSASTGSGDSSPSITNTPKDNLSINKSLVNTSMINNSSINHSLIDTTLMNISSINNSATRASPTRSSQSVWTPMDLSHYGIGRLHNDLSSYTNIMYPMAESRGSTASAAGGGGCCGGG
ncbi:MAG: hypothetical protein LUQ38_10005 [Methanotrichaceae archaeon]|nr:hypothetical protein [Methanotrichaceae archaeon]